MKRFPVIFVAAALLLAASLSARGGEHCGMLGGVCRDRCGGDESAEAGAFDDCTEKQECCVRSGPAPTAVQCCVRSLESRDRGPENCSTPIYGKCPRGTGDPHPCGSLEQCRDK